MGRHRSPAKPFVSYQGRSRTVPIIALRGDPERRPLRRSRRRAVSWLPRDGATQMHIWVRRWLAEQWPEWAPRTRTSAIEALVRFVPLVVVTEATEPPPGLRSYLLSTLQPDFQGEVVGAVRRVARCLELAPDGVESGAACRRGSPTRPGQRRPGAGPDDRRALSDSGEGMRTPRCRPRDPHVRPMAATVEGSLATKGSPVQARG